MWLRMYAKQSWHILVPLSRILQANASRFLPEGYKRKSMQIRAISQEKVTCMDKYLFRAIKMSFFPKLELHSKLFKGRAPCIMLMKP